MMNVSSTSCASVKYSPSRAQDSLDTLRAPDHLLAESEGSLLSRSEPGVISIAEDVGELLRRNAGPHAHGVADTHPVRRALQAATSVLSRALS